MLVFQQTFGFGASLQVIGGSSSKITTDLGHEAFYLGKNPSICMVTFTFPFVIST